MRQTRRNPSLWARIGALVRGSLYPGRNNPCRSALLPADRTRRLARLLAISGSITLACCVRPALAAEEPCPSGYVDLWGDGAVCVDIDECTEGNHPCASEQACVNTPGSHVCIVELPCGSGCGPIDRCVAGDGVQVCAHMVEDVGADIEPSSHLAAEY